MEYTEDADRRELLLHSAYDSDTVRAMERPLLDKGVPLMRMAAQAAAHMAAGMLDDEDLALEDTSIVLLAGAGDNGGDGLFAAAALAQEGANVTAIAVGRSLHEAGFASFVRAGGKVLVLDPAADIPGCASGFSAGEAGERLQTAIAVARKSHLIIDAMTGIGIQGSLRGIPAALASALGLDGEAPDEPALPNRESSGDFPLVLAVDTPSGVGVNDGSLPGPYIPATVTVTVGAMKPCAVLPPATFACGRIELLDFGFDIDDKDPDVEVVDNSFASDAVRLPRFEDSKYSRGVVGLVTGSQRYPGAAVLTASAAARANTGMVRYLGPERAQNMVLAALPEAVIGKGHVQSWVVGSGVPEASVEGTDGDMQRDTIAALLKHYALGSEDENKDAYDMPPIVVDAGALDLLPERVPGQVVITPHAGEMAKLLNRFETAASTAEHADSHEPYTADDVRLNPLASAKRAHELTGATVLLKGAVTIVVDEDHVYASGSAPAWLGTAGAGDVLAGLTGALLAQQDDVATTGETVASAAYLHGLAAAIASESEQQGWQEPELIGREHRQRFMTLGHPIVAGRRGPRHPRSHRRRHRMIPYVGSPQRGEPTYETPYTKSQTPLNGPNNTRSIMANSPITDVIFDFCGVLLDWNTRACLEGRFPDEIVERICADDDPCGFFRYEDRMDTGEDFADIYPDVVREQGQELADIFKFYIGHYADALPRTLPGMVELLADLKAHGYGVWGLTNWSHETFHLAFEKYPRLEQLLQGTVVSGVEKMHKPNADIYELALTRFGLTAERCVFFDDTAKNIVGANEVGIHGILFENALQARESLAELGVRL